MVICKFFLQGTCRFGDNCKFEHQINNDHNYATSTSILLQHYPNKPAQTTTTTTTTTTNVDTNTLVKSVVNDMTSAEKGGQWLLSSYAPFKEKPAFPGFEDHSMEEIRYLFYESVKNGTVEQFKQSLQMMLQQAVLKIRALQNPSADSVNLLKSIYNTPPSSSFNSSNQTPFNNAQTNSIFTSSQPQPNAAIFGGTSANQNVYNSQNASSNIFASSPPTQQSVFGGSSVFGGGQNNAMFGNQQPPAQSTSFFGNAQHPTSNSVFSGNSFFAGGSQQIFGSQTQPFPQPSPFNQQTQQALPTPQQNIFQQNVNKQFGTSQPTANKPSLQNTASIFGNLAVPTNNSVFGGIPNQMGADEDFYSKLEELSEEEIKWYQNLDDLDVDKIPEKPPTYKMCFKT